VVSDAISRLGLASDAMVCCLYATAPFVLAIDLIDSLVLFREVAARFVISVTTFPYPVLRSLHRDGSGAVSMMNPEHALTRSQDLREAWHDAGQFYWAQSSSWLNASASIFDAGAYGFALPRYRVQDIDSEEDWQRAELMMTAIRAQARDDGSCSA